MQNLMTPLQSYQNPQFEADLYACMDSINPVLKEASVSINVWHDFIPQNP